MASISSSIRTTIISDSTATTTLASLFISYSLEVFGSCLLSQVAVFDPQSFTMASAGGDSMTEATVEATEVGS